jgi:hypothetical protein
MDGIIGIMSQQYSKHLANPDHRCVSDVRGFVGLKIAIDAELSADHPMSQRK